jgi:hypothetical protein
MRDVGRNDAEKMGSSNIEAQPIIGTEQTKYSVQHPSSDLPFDKLRVGHLLPQGEKGERPTALLRSSP